MEEYFLYNLDNEEENKFLIAVDLENANVIDKVETVTVEKTDRSTEVNKHRFVNYSAHPSTLRGEPLLSLSFIHGKNRLCTNLVYPLKSP